MALAPPLLDLQLHDSPHEADYYDDVGPLPSMNDDTPKRNRKRQSQSCDACRARKVRCSRREEPVEDSQEPCKHCATLGVPCTYEYKPKKRGPPNLYLRRLKEMQAAEANGGVPHPDDLLRSKSPVRISSGRSRSKSTTAAVTFVDTTVWSPPPQSAPASHGTTGASPTAGFTAPPIVPTLSLPPSQYPIAADLIYPSPTAGPSKTPVSAFPPFGIVPTPQPFPPLRHLHRGHPTDTVAPRETIELIIGLFFDFVYPLTPCIHKPSFLADFAARREESDPLFFALLMSTVASTLVQVPRSFVPMDRSAVRKLAQDCHEASRHITVGSYDPPTSTHVVIRYFDTCYHFCEGHDATSHAAFGEAQHIAVTLHMHEEASYEGLDPIECEMRRRTFWLLFGADKSMSILLGRPICLRDEDCSVLFAKEVDDEYITPNGILPQPPGKTAIVSGLNYITRIFALLGEILVRIRVDKRSPPQGPFISARLDEVKSLHARILGALAHVPPPLRLKPKPIQHGAVASMRQQMGANGVAVVNAPGMYALDAAFAEQAFAEVRDFFDNPKASRDNLGNHFLVMQGNIYVTQQLVRFVIEQYQDELETTLRRTIGHDFSDIEMKRAEDREQVASDLLSILHSIPIQSIATNGPSLVHKVRFVASTLLDTVRNAEEAPVSAARAHAYLWDFLSILSEIERNYILDDEKDLPPDAMSTGP